MIDPINPGPAGSGGPAGAAIGPVPQDAVDSVLQYGTAVISTAIATALGQIQPLIDQAIAIVKSAIQTNAESIAQKFNSAETTYTIASNQAQTSTSALIESAKVPIKTGGTVEQGVLPDQYAWNVWSVKSLSGWGKPVVEPRSAGYKSGPDYCFRGSWEDYFDAINAANGMGPLPYDACPSPGGPATPPIGTVLPGTQCDSGLYETWQRDNADGSSDCVILCQGVAGPPGYQDAGPVPPGPLGQPIGVVFQCIPPRGGGGGGTAYYAGCDPKGNAVSWVQGALPPDGTTGIVGPFTDPTSALQAVQCSPPTGGGGGGGGGGGPCCGPDGTVMLPKCIYIDLCDWQKFYENMWQAIKKGLCEFVRDPECACKITDSEKWIMEDCDGQADAMAESWQGRIGQVVTRNNIDQLQDIAGALASQVGDSVEDTGPSPWN